jgi:hypothetical protein
VEVADFAELLLRQPPALAQSAEIQAELLVRLHSSDAVSAQTKPPQTKPLTQATVGRMERTALDERTACSSSSSGPALAPYPAWLRPEDHSRWKAAAGIATLVSSSLEADGLPGARFVWLGTRALFASDFPTGLASTDTLAALEATVLTPLPCARISE